jgi:hypothetical protein
LTELAKPSSTTGKNPRACPTLLLEKGSQKELHEYTRTGKEKVKNARI